MRSVWLVLLVLVLSWGVWQLLGTEEEWTPQRPAADPASKQGTPPTPGTKRVFHAAGVLTITVRSPGGEAPPKSEAGFLRGQGERVRRVDERGQVRFSDAPLGDLVIVARAPGFEDGTEQRFLSAGIATDVVIVLKPSEPEFTAPDGD